MGVNEKVNTQIITTPFNVNYKNRTNKQVINSTLKWYLAR